ncbi:hypothetical protein BJF78_10930 [Pseudonocardia sp. CNS-139]|nr:hypothetical protein BJF78_10930 [Pseudonocardia sp. CNS-139]
MWISLVVPLAVLLIALLLQRLEAAVLTDLRTPDPHREHPAAGAAGDPPDDPAPAPEPDPEPDPAQLAAGPVPAHPVCRSHGRRMTRATA